jgi:hypothetical protein
MTVWWWKEKGLRFNGSAGGAAEPSASKRARTGDSEDDDTQGQAADAAAGPSSSRLHAHPEQGPASEVSDATLWEVGTAGMLCLMIVGASQR